MLSCVRCTLLRSGMHGILAPGIAVVARRDRPLTAERRTRAAGVQGVPNQGLRV